MANLTIPQLDICRHAICGDTPSQFNATKATINAAVQAVETTMRGAAVQTAISNAIDAATTPTVLPAAVKKAVVKYWAMQILGVLG